MPHIVTLRIAVSFALALAASAASAHALLKQATPAVGGTVAGSPKEIRIKFSEGVEPRFSGIALASETGAPAPIGKPSVDPADPSVLIAPVTQPLKPGVYKVTWHVVSTDTHKTQGGFEFTVAP
ncbi:MAG: copper homeostasis periplasmic binding protein CopC [Roseiarcus sp.]|jgi:copper resistance protein C